MSDGPLFLGPMNPLLSLVLGEPHTFKYFFYGCLEGIARERNGNFELLAVISHNKGGGALKGLLDKLEAHYPRVTVWDVLNPRLERTLRKRGYRACFNADVDGEERSGLTKRLKRGTPSGI